STYQRPTSRAHWCTTCHENGGLQPGRRAPVVGSAQPSVALRMLEGRATSKPLISSLPRGGPRRGRRTVPAADLDGRGLATCSGAAARAPEGQAIERPGDYNSVAKLLQLHSISRGGRCLPGGKLISLRA